MKPAFGQDISLMRFFGSRKQTYANRLVINFYLGQPFTVFFSYAKKTASVFAFWPTNILRVLQVRNFTKIRQFVIGSVSINMIELIYRPFTMNVKPHKSMSVKQFVIKSNSNIPAFHPASGKTANTAPAPNFCPSKKAGFSAVFQKFMQSFWGHSVNINSAMCGGQV